MAADGAYDGEPVYRAMAERQPDPPVAVIIPRRATATLSAAAGTTPSQRDAHIQMIRDKGRLGWQKAVGYGRRSLAETAISRYKTVIGRGLRARTLPAQKTEARVGCSVLNRMTRLGDWLGESPAAPGAGAGDGVGGRFIPYPGHERRQRDLPLHPDHLSQ